MRRFLRPAAVLSAWLFIFSAAVEGAEKSLAAGPDGAGSGRTLFAASAGSGSQSRPDESAVFSGLWAGLKTVRSAGLRDTRRLFHLSLTGEQSAELDAARLIVLRREESAEAWSLVFESDQIVYENGVLTGEVPGDMLFIGCGDPDVLSEVPAFRITGADTLTIPAELVLSGSGRESGPAYQGLISAAVDRAAKTVVPREVTVWDEQAQAWTPGKDLSGYAEVNFYREFRKETQDREGVLLPFDLWKTVDTEVLHVPAGRGWSFRMADAADQMSGLCVCFEIRDRQGVRRLSELVPVAEEAPGVEWIRIDYDSQGLLTVPKVSLSLQDGQIRLSAVVRNLADQEAVVILDRLTVNGISFEERGEAYGSGENWGLLQNEEQLLGPVCIPAEKLGAAAAVISVTFSLTLENAADSREIGVVPVLLSTVWHLPGAVSP